MENNIYKAPSIIKNRKIRIALIGCGRIAYKHFDAIKEHYHDLELVAVCDVNQDSLDKATSLMGCPGYASLEELLKNSDADTITICTASGLHALQTCNIAKAGRHVITEKPMALTLQDGLDMVKVCEQEKVRLFVVKQNRMSATSQLLKRAVEQNRFGKIYLVNVNVFWTRPQSYYDEANWRGTWEFDGGTLMNQASHYVDLLVWLFGSIKSVQATIATLGRKIETEDTAILNIKWKSDALGTMNVTMLTYPKNFESSITIIGEKGTVRIGGISGNEIQHWEFQDQEKKDKDIQSTITTGHARYYENVIKVLRGEAKPEVDGYEGLKSLEVLSAAYLSAKNDSKKIIFPLEQKYELCKA